MTFNLQKCEFLRISNKIYPIFAQYLIQDEIIREVTYAKYLGVTIDQNLKWSWIFAMFMDFCDVTCIAMYPMSTKINCYKAFVKYILDYTAIVWSPYIQKDINVVEQVQRHAAKFISNNYSCLASINKMLTDIKWATLTHSRKEQKAVMLYKIVYHLVDIPASNYLTPITTSDITGDHHKRFLQPSSIIFIIPLFNKDMKFLTKYYC